ncbi:Hypothetical predicted protein, partial [Pelobates cultripes]
QQHLANQVIRTAVAAALITSDFKMATLMEHSISMSATEMVDVPPRDSPINVRRLHKRAFLARDLSSSSTDEDIVPVSKIKKKGCFSSLSSEDELDFGSSSPHFRLSSRRFKGMVPPKMKRVFPSFEVSKQF